MHKWTAALSLCLLASTPLAAAAARDGRNFDPGAMMSSRDEGAPEALDRAAFLLGDWQVDVMSHPPNGEPTRTRGRSIITYMNRGYSLMEAFYTPDHDGSGNPRSRLVFLSYVPSLGQWVWGEGDSFTEAIRLANGDFEGETLVLRDAVRPTGSGLLTSIEHRIARTADGFRYEYAVSTDGGASWKTRLIRDYSPTDDAEAGPEPESVYGEPAADLPPEAREFDFLIGRWELRHDLKLPNGANPKWTSTSEVRYALDGRAILEFDWFDTDPNLPKAATTILRIYNRAMQRWECLYLTNRSNSPLYFGGRKEGDEIVLHLFAHHAGDPQIPRFVFHDVGEDRYDWYSTVSTDRGATFSKNWIIEVRRTSAPDAAAESER